MARFPKAIPVRVSPAAVVMTNVPFSSGKVVASRGDAGNDRVVSAAAGALADGDGAMEMACSDGVGPEQDVVTRAAARTHAPLEFGKQTRCRSIDSLQVLETEWNHHQRPAAMRGDHVGAWTSLSLTAPTHR
jgi:hypothetical protein